MKHAKHGSAPTAGSRELHNRKQKDKEHPYDLFSLSSLNTTQQAKQLQLGRRASSGGLHDNMQASLTTNHTDNLSSLSLSLFRQNAQQARSNPNSITIACFHVARLFQRLMAMRLRNNERTAGVSLVLLYRSPA